MKKLISALVAVIMVLSTVFIPAFAEETTVAVTGVTVNKTTVTLTVGDTETLVATVLPEDATNKAVTWTSSKENVATVSDGVVTALSAGTTLIALTTADGEKKATCTVIVNDPVVNFGNIKMKETYNDTTIDWNVFLAVAKMNLQEGDLCYSDRNKDEMRWLKVSDDFKGKDWIAPALDWKNGVGKTCCDLWTDSTHYSDFYTFDLYKSAEVTIFATADTKLSVMEEEGWTYNRDTNGYLIGYTSQEMSYNHKFTKIFEVTETPVKVSIPNIGGVSCPVVIDYDYVPEPVPVNFGNIKMKETYNDEAINWGSFVAKGRTNLQAGDLCFSDRENYTMIWSKVSEHYAGLDWIAPALDWKNGVGKPHELLWTDETYYSDFYTFDLYKSAEVTIFATNDDKVDFMEADGWVYARDTSGYLTGYTSQTVQYNHQFTKYFEVGDASVKVSIPNVGGVSSPVVLDYDAEKNENNDENRELEPGFHPLVGARYTDDFIADEGVLDGKVSLRSLASAGTVYSRYTYGPLRGLKDAPEGKSGARWVSNPASSPTFGQYHEIYYVDEFLQGYDYFTSTSNNTYSDETLIEFKLAESADVVVLSNVDGFALEGFVKEKKETSWVKARYLNKPFALAIEMLGVKPDYDIASTITKGNADSFVDTYYAEEYAALGDVGKEEFDAAWEEVIANWISNDVRELIGIPYSYKYAHTKTYRVPEGETLTVTIPGDTSGSESRTPIIIVKPVLEIVPENTELASLSVDGVEVNNFKPNIYDYTVEIPGRQEDFPVVTYTKGAEDATVEVVNPTEFPGKTVINVSKDGEETKTYTITYVISGGLVSELEILEDNIIPDVYGGGTVTLLPKFVEKGLTVGSQAYNDRNYTTTEIMDERLIGLDKIIGCLDWYNSSTTTATVFKSEDTLPWLNFKLGRDAMIMVFLASCDETTRDKLEVYGYDLETNEDGYFTNTLNSNMQTKHIYKFYKHYSAGETVTVPNAARPRNDVYTVLIDADNYASLQEDESNTEVSVTGVTLNKTSVTLTEGDTETLTATVAPENATNKAVTWTSSDESVATVTNGIVTAKSAGTATITVKTWDGEYSAICTVTINSEASSIITGDANGDGEVDFADAIIVLKHDAGVSVLSGENLAAADTNEDGEVDFVDAIQILKYESGLISSFK